MSHEPTVTKLAEVTSTITSTLSYYLRLDGNDSIALDVQEVSGSIGYNIYTTVDPDITANDTVWTDATGEFGILSTITGSNILIDDSKLFKACTGIKLTVMPVTTVGINYVVWAKRV